MKNLLFAYLIIMINSIDCFHKPKYKNNSLVDFLIFLLNNFINRLALFFFSKKNLPSNPKPQLNYSLYFHPLLGNFIERDQDFKIIRSSWHHETLWGSRNFSCYIFNLWNAFRRWAFRKAQEEESLYWKRNIHYVEENNWTHVVHA